MVVSHHTYDYVIHTYIIYVIHTIYVSYVSIRYLTWDDT